MHKQLGMDFLINLYHGLKIVYADMHKTKNAKERQEMIDELVLTKRIETVIPLTYMTLIAIAYYCPNAEILMGIKLSLWHNVAIADISQFFTTLSLLFGVDLLSFVLNGILLKVFCNVNILTALKRVQTNFWVFMIWEEANMFLEVKFFCGVGWGFLFFVTSVFILLLILQLYQAYSIGAGFDLTFAIDWRYGWPQQNSNLTLPAQ